MPQLAILYHMVCWKTRDKPLRQYVKALKDDAKTHPATYGIPPSFIDYPMQAAVAFTHTFSSKAFGLSYIIQTIKRYFTGNMNKEVTWEFSIKTNHHISSKTVWSEIFKISSIFFIFQWNLWNREPHHSVAKGLDAYFLIPNISGYNIYRSKCAPTNITNGPYCKSLKTS